MSRSRSATMTENRRAFAVGDRVIRYRLRRSARARYLRISVSAGGDVAVTLPLGEHVARAEAFLREKTEWLLEKLRELGPGRAQRGSRRDYLAHRETARAFILERLERFAPMYGFSYGRVAIRNQKTCWGSCSEGKNLNFNYQILFLPPKLADYVVIHELCHLKEFNHSSRFWALVGRACSDYRTMRRTLRDIERVM